MLKQHLKIGHIPAVIWGEPSNRVFLAVHGDQSNKEDQVIEVLAQEATKKGYQVLSFDLPEHGERKQEPTQCHVKTCVKELTEVMAFARVNYEKVSLFACSMGAYFSLIANQDAILRQSLFLSPVVDMGRIIENMMKWYSVSQQRLQEEGEIPTPAGPTLYWDYFCYVRDNPVVRWQSPTAILYGSEDQLCEFEFVVAFADKFACELEVMAKGEHYFHTPAQLNVYREWLRKHLR